MLTPFQELIFGGVLSFSYIWFPIFLLIFLFITLSVLIIGPPCVDAIEKKKTEKAYKDALASCLGYSKNGAYKSFKKDSYGIPLLSLISFIIYLKKINKTSISSTRALDEFLIEEKNFIVNPTDLKALSIGQEKQVGDFESLCKKMTEKSKKRLKILKKKSKNILHDIRYGWLIQNNQKIMSIIEKLEKKSSEKNKDIFLLAKRLANPKTDSNFGRVEIGSASKARYFWQVGEENDIRLHSIAYKLQDDIFQPKSHLLMTETEENQSTWMDFKISASFNDDDEKAWLKSRELTLFEFERKRDEELILEEINGRVSSPFIVRDVSNLFGLMLEWIKKQLAINSILKLKNDMKNHDSAKIFQLLLSLNILPMNTHSIFHHSSYQINSIENTGLLPYLGEMSGEIFNKVSDLLNKHIRRDAPLLQIARLESSLKF
ncbi:MAG: hypothetical protein ACXQS8_08580, partial [Candidatus Helarchaeales archaeon]